MLYVVDHALVLCTDIMQNADNGYTSRDEYHMMPAELGVRWRSPLLCAECLHNTKKYSFATCSQSQSTMRNWAGCLCCVVS